MPKKIQLNTERCQLIPFTTEDAQLFHHLNTDAFIRKYMWDDECIDWMTTNEILAQNKKHFEQNQYGIWKIILKKTNETVGYAGFWYFFEESQPQLIYALLQAYIKQGLATEVSRRLLKYAFCELTFDYLIAATDEPHLDSQKVAKAIGMNFIEKRMENGKPTLFYKIEKADFEKYNSLQAVQADLTTSEITIETLVQQYLENIEKTKDLNIYIEVFEEEALSRAKLLDQKTPAQRGKLYGMVLAIKDVLCYANHQVTAASKILQGFTSPFSATAIQQLLKEDAIIIGRVNCDEFAMGSSNENSCYGVTRNAADSSKVPGGSSGASAVAVQAKTCLAALGSDTGGSVRQPAAFCGVIGMKPTYGRISRYGLLAYGSSFDQIGVLSNSIEDAALLLEVMAGKDEFDSTVSQLPVPEYSKNLNFEGKAKIAYFQSALEHEKLDPEIKKQTFDYIENLKKQGHQVKAIDFDYLDQIIPAYYVLTTAEASSNLSRYDGIRYGYRSNNVNSLQETYTKTRTEGFGTEVKRRIMLGTFVLSAGYYDAYYTKAQQVRQLIWQRTKEVFTDYDFILMPTSPTPAWSIGELNDDPVAVYLSDVFTVIANMTGIPAIALPLGIHSSGLPIGVQLMANRFEEEKLLRFSKQISIN